MLLRYFALFNVVIFFLSEILVRWGLIEPYYEQTHFALYVIVWILASIMMQSANILKSNLYFQTNLISLMSLNLKIKIGELPTKSDTSHELSQKLDKKMEDYLESLVRQRENW